MIILDIKLEIYYTFLYFEFDFFFLFVFSFFNFQCLVTFYESYQFSKELECKEFFLNHFVGLF